MLGELLLRIGWQSGVSRFRDDGGWAPLDAAATGEVLGNRVAHRTPRSVVQRM